MSTDDEPEILEQDDAEADVDQAEPTVSDSFDVDDSLIEAELGEIDELPLDDARIEDETELDTQFDETIEDSREILLLQELGIDLDDVDDLPSALDYEPSLHDDETMDDEAAA